MVSYTNLENNLNISIGYSWWKKYIAAAFWSNISTPINFIITLLTALNTGQATTGNFISSELFVNLNIATLVISTFNTFFKPNEQYNNNLKNMHDWLDFGIRFETIYFTISDETEKYNAYIQLQQDINKYENSESPNTQNFFTDLLNCIAINSCLKKRERWLDFTLECINDLEIKTINTTI